MQQQQHRGGDNMALIDRLARDPNIPTDKRIGGHFETIILLYLLGRATRTQAINGLNLETEDEVQLDALKTHFDGLNNADKTQFGIIFSGVINILTAGIITKAQAKTLLGL